MYNNEITYAKEWDTPENRKALEELDRKYFSSSECSPDCPVSWAPEVLELMNKLQNELGFARNTSTMRGYYIQGNPKDWFIVDPWSNLFSAFKSNFIGKPLDTIYTEKGRDKVVRPFHKRIIKLYEAFTHSIKYGFRAIKIKYINAILNKIDKPKIRLGQLKEKYGELTCYFHTSDAYEEYVDNEVRKTELKLAKKGAYYPIESFWDAGASYSVGTEYRPDIITTKVDESDGTIDVTETKYRAAMKELGFDLKQIKEKAELRKAIKESQQNAKN